MNIDRDLIAASVTPLVLSLLGQEECYGYRLIQRVKQCSDGRLAWSEGMLYPVLHRLEKRGLITSYWKTAENGRRRKYYALAEKGRLELERQRQEWLVVASALRRSGFHIPLEAG